MEPRKRITKKDIASRLNISIATVDRVFNNRGYVSPKTRELVLETAREINYIPNRNAMYLSKKKTCCIGVSYIFSDWFAEQIEYGIHHAEQELMDYGLLQVIASKDAHTVKEQIEKIRDMLPMIDALAVSPREPSEEFTSLINEVIESGKPVICFNTDAPMSKRIAYVGSDYLRAGRAAAEMMRYCVNSQGDVGNIIRNRSLTNISQRITGFRQYMSKHTGVHIIGPFNVSSGEADAVPMEQILKENSSLRGLIVMSDNLGHVAEEVTRLGYKGKVAIIGFDLNSRHVTLLERGDISAVICQQPVYQGYEAVRMLFDYIMEKKAPQKTENITKFEIVMQENLDTYYDRDVLHQKNTWQAFPRVLP